MKKLDIELLAGIFLIIGFAALAYLSMQLGNVRIFGEKGYTIHARFNKIGGLKRGAPVEIAGVEIGKVREIALEGDTYQAEVAMSINTAIKLQKDTIASVKTKGLLGEKYVQLSPGASEPHLKEGDKLRETESAVDIEELISKYAFGNVK
ncbi:MAG: outer membrane lipid asymmetry maintenance protein MlaD [Nitrospirae bacterium]|nr:outer membrane lipid asymmetry maintenance protein MlaD [Nitrospirota bacterium]